MDVTQVMNILIRESLPGMINLVGLLLPLTDVFRVEVVVELQKVLLKKVPLDK